MSTIKTHIAQAIKIFGIMAIVAAFAAAAFPTRSFAADSNTGKLIVNVYQASSNPASSVALQPVADASIEVFDVNGRSVASVSTNNSGSNTIELPKGLYKVYVTAPGFKAASGSVAVDAGKTTSIKFELRSTARIHIGGR